MVLTGPAKSSIRLYRNLGNRTFIASTFLTPPNSGEDIGRDLNAVAVGDINGDLKPDIIAATYWYWNGSSRNVSRSNAVYLNNEDVKVQNSFNPIKNIIARIDQDAILITWDSVRTNIISA